VAPLSTTAERSEHAIIGQIAEFCIPVFPILADVVEVKTGSRSTAHWRIHFIRSNGWLGNSFAQLITLLDIDGIGQNWEGSNTRLFWPADSSDTLLRFGMARQHLSVLALFHGKR